MNDWMKQAVLVAAVECRLHMSGTFWRILLVLSAVLAATMTFANLRDYSRRQSEADILVARRDAATEDGQHTVTGFQRDEALRVIRNPTALSVAVTGLDRHMPQYWDFGPEGMTAGAPGPEKQAASVAGADLDLEFILRGLIGMMALAAGVASMVTSKHGATAKSLVALPVRPSALIVGAMVGGTVAAAVASAVVVASSMATFLAGARTLVSPDGVSTLVALWLAATLYGGALVGTGAVIALTASNISRAVACMTVFWLGTTTIAGPVISAMADMITPNRSRALFETARNSEYEDAITTVESDAGEIVLRQPGTNDIPREFILDGALIDAVGQHWDRRMMVLRAELDKLESDFRDSERTRAALAWWLANILPGTAFGYSATELAGVGESNERRWTEAAQAYHRALSMAVFDAKPRLHMRVPAGSGYRVLFHDRATRSTVQNLPAFRQHAAMLLMRFRDAVPSLVSLVVQGTAIWILAIAIFVRRQSSVSGWR